MTKTPEIEYRLCKRPGGSLYHLERVADGVIWESAHSSPDPVGLYELASKAAFAERERLGWPPGDPRIQFPERPGKASAG